MDRAVATEDQDRIGFLRAGWHADEPCDTRILLKRL